MCSGSAEFRELWEDVDPGVWRNQTKTLVHPSLDAITLECDTLHVPDSDQLLVVYSAELASPGCGARRESAVGWLRRSDNTEAQCPCRVAHPGVVGDEVVDADPHGRHQM